MPRSASGVYTLPLPPVIPDTVIQSAWANTTLDDVTLALTDSLDRYGRGGMVAPFRTVSGTEALPGIAFSDSTGSGMWVDGTHLGFSFQGDEKMSLSNTGASFSEGLAATVLVNDGTPVAVVPLTGADSLVINGAGNTGITFAGTSGSSIQQIAFADAGSSNVGGIAYSHATDIMGFRAADTPLMFLSSIGLFVATTLTVSTTDGDLAGLLESGVYNAIGTPLNNVSLPSSSNLQWCRVGACVTVSGYMEVDPVVAALPTSFSIPLPVASAFSSIIEAGGAGVLNDLAGVRTPVAIYARPANNEVEFAWDSPTVNVAKIHFSFMYQIV